MAVEGGMKCVKFLLFSFNFVFLLCGLAVIVVGVVVGATLSSLPESEQEASKGSSTVITVVGVVIFFIAFFGCCGAWKENYCMVTTFVILLSLVLITEILLSIGGYVLTNTMLVIMDEGLQEMISEYETNEEFKDGMDKMQQMLKCCGGVNVSDWADFQADGISVPDSCCRNITLNCGIGAMNNGNEIYTRACGTALENLIKLVRCWFGVAALVIAFIEILAVVFACTLMRGIHKGYEVM
ncbi:CD63 antigen isoform X2 [Pangasianodon hypophthalmus]|uniref:CD63 antigen isoform X2 n=1 Tax=Pangasianodon hypophthalmus TaxID=310915 RepID=UPI000EFFE1C4|nr:CD63 antigen isoform X2 [Pangasianodon hypophthalmus]